MVGGGCCTSSVCCGVVRAVAMAVMVVVVGRWRFGGTILWGLLFFSEEQAPGKRLPPETKIAKLIT